MKNPHERKKVLTDTFVGVEYLLRLLYSLRQIKTKTMEGSFIEMRKHQTLLVVGILLLASAGVAQAQGVYEVFSNPLIARSGGAGETGW